MHNSASHTGISGAGLRLSQIAVPVGHVPSAGNADTGRRSPRPAIISAVTRLTNSGAWVPTGSGISNLLVAAAGIVILCRVARVSSIAFQLASTTSLPFLL